MAVCEITGKGKMYGHHVSFSQKRTNRAFNPNIQKKTLVVDGKKVKLNVSAKAIRTLKKKGLLKK
ncbi:MAG: 50S ribosomal protein L28 [Candidatus Nomurabacteria bacterium]|jgi:large subunit ribosomal protein L28|nr:50S ribosomal protein L28 [Candidatus Nomurabacteria bacterium]